MVQREPMGLYLTDRKQGSDHKVFLDSGEDNSIGEAELLHQRKRLLFLDGSNNQQHSLGDMPQYCRHRADEIDTVADEMKVPNREDNAFPREPESLCERRNHLGCGLENLLHAVRDNCEPAKFEALRNVLHDVLVGAHDTIRRVYNQRFQNEAFGGNEHGVIKGVVMRDRRMEAKNERKPQCALQERGAKSQVKHVIVKVNEVHSMTRKDGSNSS